jgi:hypothetical protein
MKVIGQQQRAYGNALSMLRTTALITLLVSSTASAYQGYHLAKIDQIILDGSAYNGCMVKLSEDLPSDFACSRKDFVSLDCDGADINTKAFANQMLQTTQLALVTDKTVRLRVTDSILVNGNFCVADYIRINK